VQWVGGPRSYRVVCVRVKVWNNAATARFKLGQQLLEGDLVMTATITPEADTDAARAAAKVRDTR
jgi:hypothetical protein